MLPVLRDLQEAEAADYKKYRTEFFQTVIKPDPSPDDRDRLLHCCKVLGWDAKILAMISELIERERQMARGLQSPAPVQGDDAGFQEQLRALTKEWDERSKEFEKRRHELCQKIAGVYNAISQRKSLEREHCIIREKFAPIFGGDEWGKLDDSIGGALYFYLDRLRKLDESAAKQ